MVHHSIAHLVPMNWCAEIRYGTSSGNTAVRDCVSARRHQGVRASERGCQRGLAYAVGAVVLVVRAADRGRRLRGFLGDLLRASAGGSVSGVRRPFLTSIGCVYIGSIVFLYLLIEPIVFDVFILCCGVCVRVAGTC